MGNGNECQIADSLGEILSRQRRGLGMGVGEISARIGVPERWILSAESDRWAEIPDDAYSRIYYRSLCRFLRLDHQAMVGPYRQARQRAGLGGKAAKTRHHPTTAVPKWQMAVATQMTRRGILCAIGLGLVGYFWWSVANIVTPPKIVLSAPADGLVTEDRSVTVKGMTEREVDLLINGKAVATDGHGFFRDELNLAEGLNTITIAGSKKHSRVTTVIRRIIYQPDTMPTAKKESETKRSSP
ncbi:helix-turn-helix domain-containing protein [Candidatus Uhrbacteria bacterium]|nr:helix-turn-helix domain-containing protein [Candidatus Uhrbacteria bacterium]